MLYGTSDIEKSFAGKKIIDGFSFEINKGEMTAVLGRKGDGITTLSQILAGIIKPDGGEIISGGRVISSAKSNKEICRLRRRAVSYVTSVPVFMEGMTLYDNFLLTDVRSKGGSKSKKIKAKETLKFLGLIGKGKSYPGELTDVELYKASLARGILNSPILLICDDPSAYLDSSQLDDIMDDFEKINESGITLVIVTKSRKIASRCRRVVAMNSEIDTENIDAKAIVEEEIEEVSEELYEDIMEDSYETEETDSEYDEEVPDYDDIVSEEDDFRVDIGEFFGDEDENS